MTPPITTTAECADALERTHERLRVIWGYVMKMPVKGNGPAISCRILEAQDKLALAIRDLRAIGQGAACAEEEAKTIWSAGPCSTCKMELATWEPRYICDVCHKALCPYCLSQAGNRRGVTRCEEHEDTEVD